LCQPNCGAGLTFWPVNSQQIRVSPGRRSARQVPRVIDFWKMSIGASAGGWVSEGCAVGGVRVWGSWGYGA